MRQNGQPHTILYHSSRVHVFEVHVHVVLGWGVPLRVVSVYIFLVRNGDSLWGDVDGESAPFISQRHLQYDHVQFCPLASGCKIRNTRHTTHKGILRYLGLFVSRPGIALGTRAKCEMK